MSKELHRNKIDQEETWDLSHFFKTEAEFEQAIMQTQEDVKEFVETYKGKLKEKESVNACLSSYANVYEAIVPLDAYASLNLSVDQTDESHQIRASRWNQILAELMSELSFVDSELLALPKETLEAAIHHDASFSRYLLQLIEKKPYTLDAEVEKVLASFTSIFEAPYELYNTTKMLDLEFPDFKVKDQRHSLSYLAFEGSLEYEPDTEKRRAAFNAFSKELRKYQHTTAKTYDLHIQTEKKLADLRGYDSVTDYLLQTQEVDKSLYNRQIDLIMDELAPHMRKYAKLIKKVYNLKTMTYADLKVPLDPTYVPRVTYEEAQKYIKDALGLLGEDYNDMLDRAFDERWIDYAQNKGKSTGAFCSSPFGVHPYILISWSNQMEDVFTLIHELGHAGHFNYANAHQNIFNANSSMYFVEAPSTMNEMLLANNLLNKSTDKRFKRWVIATLISGTYYHNFVTHLLEAAYQREVYKLVDAKENVNAAILNQLKRDVLESFWGDAVEITEGAELTWMRQPHYYMGLYPYTYSAGLTISTQVSRRILEEGQPAVDDWINVLKLGGSKKPIELAQLAGVDISTEEPLRETINYIGSLVDELSQLID